MSRGEVVIRGTVPEHAQQLEKLQKLVFPTLAPQLRLRAEHYRAHVELFPEGQFVALDGERVVGGTTSIRLNVDFEHYQHRFDEVLQGGWLGSHDPEGEWLYGIDIAVDPHYRRRGIARRLYAARQETVSRLGLRGQATVGMLSGYGAVKDSMTIESYYEGVCHGEIQDPTLTAQMRIGFRPCGLVYDYLDDPSCGNCGALIVLDATQTID